MRTGSMNKNLSKRVAALDRDPLVTDLRQAITEQIGLMTSLWAYTLLYSASKGEKLPDFHSVSQEIEELEYCWDPAHRRARLAQAVVRLEKTHMLVEAKKQQGLAGASYRTG